MRRVVVIVQNLVFWTLFFVVSGVFIPAATVLVTLIGLTTPRRFAMRCVRRSISWYGWTILRCGWPFVRVEYRDLAPKERDPPYVFVCNHRSASDPFLMACLPFEGIQIVNKWPFKLPVLGIVARFAEYISIMEISFDTFHERTAALLAKKVCIVAFPEGTRSGSRKMGPFGSAIFRVARDCRARIVPLAISGNEDIPHKGSVVLHPGRVRVHKLPAVTWDEYRDMNPYRLKNHVQELLREHLAQVEGASA